MIRTVKQIFFASFLIFFMMSTASSHEMAKWILSDEEFSTKLDKSRAKNSKSMKYKPLDQKEVVLTDKSMVPMVHIGGQRNWTAIPKKSIIYMPERLKPALTRKRGLMIPWESFLSKNRGLVQVQKVTMNQARGSEKLDAKVVEAYKSGGRIVVAVYNGNLVSVNENALVSEPSE